MDCEILNSIEPMTIVLVSSSISATVTIILNSVLNYLREQDKLKKQIAKGK